MVRVITVYALIGVALIIIGILSTILGPQIRLGEPQLGNRHAQQVRHRLKQTRMQGHRVAGG